MKPRPEHEIKHEQHKQKEVQTSAQKPTAEAKAKRREELINLYIKEACMHGK